MSGADAGHVVRLLFRVVRGCNCSTRDDAALTQVCSPARVCVWWRCADVRNLTSDGGRCGNNFPCQVGRVSIVSTGRRSVDRHAYRTCPSYPSVLVSFASVWLPVLSKPWSIAFGSSWTGDRALSIAGPWIWYSEPLSIRLSGFHSAF